MTERTLRLLYRDIPTFSCRPGCTDCCGPVPWSPEELARIDVPIGAEWVEIKGVRALTVVDALRCPFAQGGRCVVYDRRPFMCRLFGSVAGEPRLTCPHGCHPGKPLTATRAASLADQYRRMVS